jgi:chromosome segregation ATPase
MENLSIHPSHRTGSSGIAAILEDMLSVLPPQTSTRPEYRACRTTYGMMKSFLNSALESAHPLTEYKELQKMEPALRCRLHAMKAKKGVPPKMIELLDELKGSVAEIVGLGDDGVRRLHEMEREVEGLLELGTGAYADHDHEPNSKRMEKGKEKMVPESKLKKVRDSLLQQLKEANEKIAQLNSRIAPLNAENNRLTLQLRHVAAERDQALRERNHALRERDRLMR